MKNIKKFKEVINMNNKEMICDHKSLNVIKSKLSMDSKIVTENDDTFLKVSLKDCFYALVRDDSTFEKNRPFNVVLTYNDESFYNISTDTVEDTILLVKEMKNVAESLVLLGYDDEYDVKSLSNEISRMIKRREKIHNLLVDYNFKIGDNESIKELSNMGINPDDYVIKNKSFMNKKTKKFVTTY